MGLMTFETYKNLYSSLGNKRTFLSREGFDLLVSTALGTPAPPKGLITCREVAIFWIETFRSETIAPCSLGRGWTYTSSGAS